MKHWEERAGRAEKELAELLQALGEAESVRGIADSPCYFCGQPTNCLAGDPGLWPVSLPTPDRSGVTQTHHVACVCERLHKLTKAEAACAEKDQEIQRLTLIGASDAVNVSPLSTVISSGGLLPPIGYIPASELDRTIDLLTDIVLSGNEYSSSCQGERERLEKLKSKQDVPYCSRCQSFHPVDQPCLMPR